MFSVIFAKYCYAVERWLRREEGKRERQMREPVSDRILVYYDSLVMTMILVFFPLSLSDSFFFWSFFSMGSHLS